MQRSIDFLHLRLWHYLTRFICFTLRVAIPCSTTPLVETMAESELLTALTWFQCTTEDYYAAEHYHSIGRYQLDAHVGSCAVDYTWCHTIAPKLPAVRNSAFTAGTVTLRIMINGAANGEISKCRVLPLNTIWFAEKTDI